MALKSTVLIAIPVYNEEQFIRELIDQVCQFIEPKNILIIDDGSTDNTAAIISQLPVLSIAHTQNRGKGAALMSAIRYAKTHYYTWILTMDGDGQHRTKHIKDFLAAIQTEEADCILSNRQNRGAAMPAHRRLSNGTTSIFISLCSGMQRIHDSQCGFRAVRLDCLDPDIFKERGFQFESEMILRLGKKGCRFREIPIETSYGNEASSIHLVKDTLKFIKLVIKSFSWT